MSNFTGEEIKRIADFLYDAVEVCHCSNCRFCKTELMEKKHSVSQVKLFCSKFIDAETGKEKEVTTQDYCSFGEDDGLPF